jgi:translation initiation factor 5A
MRALSSRRLQTSIMSDIASKTIPTQASALRKGSYVLLKDKPCKIVDLSTSKTGKHGHAKIKMTGIDIFTGQKVEDLSPSTHNMEVPVVKKDELQVCVCCVVMGKC